MSSDEALAMFIVAKLTKPQHSIIRDALLKKGVKVLPEYRHITNAKFRFEQGKTNLHLILKYGCGGTSGFTQYKQAFAEARNLEGNSVFIICTVSIFLRFSQHRHADINFWQNKNPCSTKLCRPVRFTYEKESEELKSEISKIQNEIR